MAMVKNISLSMLAEGGVCGFGGCSGKWKMLMVRVWPRWLYRDRCTDSGICIRYLSDVCVYIGTHLSVCGERRRWASLLGWAMWSTQGWERARGCWASSSSSTLLPAHRCDRRLHPFLSPFPFRPRRMSGSPSGRSWLWAVSSTMARDFTPAAARAASRAFPPGKPGGLAAQNLVGGWKVGDASSGTSRDLPFRGSLNHILEFSLF